MIMLHPRRHSCCRIQPDTFTIKIPIFDALPRHHGKLPRIPQPFGVLCHILQRLLNLWWQLLGHVRFEKTRRNRQSSDAVTS